MTIELGKTDKQYLLSFPKEMTIFSVLSLRERLKELLVSFDNEQEIAICLDFCNTSEIDWAGVQLVISLIKTLQNTGFHAIRLFASDGVLANFEFLSIEDNLSIEIRR